MRIFAWFFILLFVFGHTVQAQDDLPPCSERPTSLSEPWIQSGLACLERVIAIPNAPELSFTALAAAPDGTLYAARPLTGEVIALIDEDGDGLPETPHTAASGLTLPNALAYSNGTLYISGGAYLYRLQDGTLTTLVDDLPTGEFWTGGVAALDDRLYVGIGAACDACEPSNPEQGTVLSFALDGSDRRIEAHGLRNPSALAVADGALYVTDGARDALFATPDLDEIDRLTTPGEDFGFPYCIGVGSTPDLPGLDCQTAARPTASLPTGGVPTGLAYYESDAIPSLAGKLLVVLNGSRQQLELRGYRLVAVDPLSGALTDVMPAKPDDSPGSNFTVDQMNYRGSGFYPHRLIGIAVTQQGWIYLSIGGGRILALRP